MAVLEPQSNITLVNVPWDNNYQNVRNFNDIGAQNTYFSNLFPRINFEDYTYLRKGSSIRVGVGVDEIASDFVWLPIPQPSRINNNAFFPIAKILNIN